MDVGQAVRAAAACDHAGWQYRIRFRDRRYGLSGRSRKTPELAAFSDNILLWRDRFSPSADEQDETLSAHPYLGSGHEFLEKAPGRAPYLRNIHVFNPAAFVSFGLPIETS